MWLFAWANHIIDVQLRIFVYLEFDAESELWVKSQNFIYIFYSGPNTLPYIWAVHTAVEKVAQMHKKSNLRHILLCERSLIVSICKLELCRN